MQHVNLASRTAWTAAGQATFIVTQFLILIALTRLSTLEAVGQFGLATAIVTPIYWLTDLGLRTNKNTDAKGTLSFANLFALRLITSLIGYAAICAASLLFTSGNDTRTILLIFGAAKGVETLSDICYGVFERHGRMPLFARSIAVRGILSLAIFTMILKETGSVGAAFLSQLIVWGVVFLGHDIWMARKLSRGESQRVEWGRLWPTAWESRHLGISRFLTALRTSIPRFIVERMIGLEALGIFTALSYVMQASTTLMTSVSRSIIGHLADLKADDNVKAFQRIIGRYAGLTLLVGVAAMAAAWSIGDPLLVFIFGADFSGQVTLLMLFLLTATLRALFVILQAGPLASRSFRYLVRLQMISLVLTTIAVVIGAYLGALVGAAVGLVIGAAIQVLLILAFFRGTAARD